MYAAVLLLLPAAGLPPLPALRRRHLAGYEYRVVEPWGGRFRFYPDGRWQHVSDDGSENFRGWWEIYGGRLVVYEDRIVSWTGYVSDEVAVPYYYDLAPDPRLWFAEGRLSGRYVGCWGNDRPGKHWRSAVFNRPRRIKP